VGLKVKQKGFPGPWDRTDDFDLPARKLMDCSCSGQDISKIRLCQFEEMPRKVFLFWRSGRSRQLQKVKCEPFQWCEDVALRRVTWLSPFPVLSGHYSYCILWCNCQQMAVRWAQNAHKPRPRPSSHPLILNLEIFPILVYETEFYTRFMRAKQVASIPLTRQSQSCINFQRPLLKGSIRKLTAKEF
jgi:hypothetical protein